jgi:transcriptional regulator with XRE-family HTH domain
MTLAEYVTELGACSDLARRMGVPHSTVWRWANGERTPSVVWALKMDRVTDGVVPVSSWGESKHHRKSTPRHSPAKRQRRVRAA